MAATTAAEPEPFVLSWNKNILTIRRSAGAAEPNPGGEIQIAAALQAYCRRPVQTNRGMGADDDRPQDEADRRPGDQSFAAAVHAA